MKGELLFIINYYCLNIMATENSKVESDVQITIQELREIQIIFVLAVRIERPFVGKSRCY